MMMGMQQSLIMPQKIRSLGMTNYKSFVVIESKFLIMKHAVAAMNWNTVSTFLIKIGLTMYVTGLKVTKLHSSRTSLIKASTNC